MTDAKWVAVVGDNTIDRYVASGSDYSGGNAFNVAVQLARAGVTVRYFGAVGDDEDAQVILRGLAANGVPTDDVVVLPGRTAVTRIRLNPDGDRVFESEAFGVTADYDPDEGHLAQIALADWVHIGMVPQPTRLRTELAIRGNGVVSQDCAVSSGTTFLDVAFVSIGEGGNARAAVDAITRMGIPVVVGTRGAEGSVALADGEILWQSAIATDVVDTTGAGDSFIAGFISERLRGGGYAAALESGATFAAATCRHFAGWPHPERERESA